MAWLIGRDGESKLQRVEPARFGSTLGHYGVGYGPYVQLPFYGSFTLRDEGGDMADDLYPVLSWLTWPMSIGKWMVEGVETRAAAGFRRLAPSVLRSVYFNA